MEGMTLPPEPGTERPAYVSKGSRCLRGAARGWRLILGTVWCPVCGRDLDITPFPLWRRLLGLTTYHEAEWEQKRIKMLEAEIARLRRESDGFRDEQLRRHEEVFEEGVMLGMEVEHDIRG